MSFTERAGLFPVLLLTGCAQQSVVTGPPSGSVVDSMLSRSAADISAMQYRIHQSGPSAQRPGPPKASVTAAPAAAKTAALLPAVSAAARKAPAGLTGAGPSDGFVRQGGAAPTLRAALRSIVPPGQTVVFDKTVSADAPELWQWAGNDRWPYVADKLLAPHGLKATVNAATRTVTIEPAQHGQTQKAAPAGASLSVPANKPAKAASPGAVRPVPLPTTGRNPFRGSQAAPVRPGAAGEVPAPKQAIPAAPVMPVRVVQIRHWRIEPGNTVKDWLYSQATNETCSAPGIKNWTVAWLTPVNYRVDGPLEFSGSFREMLNQLFTLYGAAKVPLYAATHAAQCVLQVDDKEVH